MAKSKQRNSEHTSAEDSNRESNGLVVSRFGNQVEIEDNEGALYRCHIRRSLQDLVSGDRVLWKKEFSSDSKVSGVVTKICERSTVLKRNIRYEGLKPIAANLDRVFVVTAPEPAFSSRILDRYLVAIELENIEAVIVLNKIDRLADYPELEQQLKMYTDIGYNVLQISAQNSIGLEALKETLESHLSVLVGQSGVGKSSIINSLLPDEDTSVSELSETSGLGTHTTTVSKLYHLSSGGHLIDSPGIREFTLGHINKSDLAYGFREFLSLIGQCKFRDCTHRIEPGCAIIKAAKSGDIHPSRLESYYKLYTDSDEML